MSLRRLIKVPRERERECVTHGRPGRAIAIQVSAPLAVNKNEAETEAPRARERQPRGPSVPKMHDARAHTHI
eukprot:1403887-Prymnesium_polylepis.1